MKLLTALPLLLAMPLSFAATPQDFAALLPIEIKGESAAWQIELNEDVYRWSNDPDLRDLLVFNAAGRAVPMATWRVAAADKVREQSRDVITLALPNLPQTQDRDDLRLLVQRNADGVLQRIETGSATRQSNSDEPRDWLIDLGSHKQPVDTLDLRWTTPATGVIARFAIDASEDLQSWRTLRNDAAVVLLDQDGNRVERRDINLPPTRAQYLRLRRLDSGPALLELRAQARRTERESEVLAAQWIKASVEAEAGSNGTRYLAQLPAALPVELLRLDLGNDNALASVTLSSPARGKSGKPQWNELARFVAFRLRQGSVLIDHGEISLASSPRQKQFMLESRTPLAQAPALEFGYHAQRMIFLADGAGPYQLAVGSAREQRTDAPLELALSGLRSEFGANWQPPEVVLGTARQSAGVSALTPAAAEIHWQRWLLWILLIGGAGTVAAIALSLLRGKRQGGDEQGKNPPEKQTPPR